MGFTLVELMVVIAIIGVAAGAVLLSMPDPRPTLAVEAERFAARLTLAREEAVMTNRPVALRADAAGYGFESFGEYLISKGADDSIVNADGLTCYEGLSKDNLGQL